MCEEGVATAIEPQLCEPKTFDIRVDTSLQREREKICVYGIGQQFVEYARLLTVPRVANRFGWSQDQFVNGTLVGRAACCWSPERLQQSFDTIAAEFKTANDTLSARSFARLSSEIRLRTAAERDIDFQSPGFDGLTLLNITDDEFREDLVILYPKARSYLHHYIEKLWNFRRPLPCPAGAYCNAGTCPRYLLTGIVDVDFDRPSNALEEARRLAETHYTEKLREVFYNRTWNITIPPDMEQGEEMGGHANDSNDSSWSPLNRSDRWDKPSDCFDKNETEPREGKARTSAPKQDATFEHFRVLSEFQQMSTETLGAPAPLQRLNEPMHQQYAVGKAASLAPELAFRQLLAHRKELSEEEWLRLWTNVSADIASKIRANGTANVSLGNWTWFAQNASGEDITRRLQEETFLATTEYPLEAINPLSMRAPQQCKAGTYCDARAGSSAGTGLCPPGKYCPPGAGDPAEAPEGVFVDGSGSVRGVECFPGQFAPFTNTPTCYPCPAGASCPDFGTTTPFICPPGTFREPSLGEGSSSTISCEPCPAGTWSPWRGTPDFSSCEPCPEGRVCVVGTGNVSEGIICPEGHICGSGTTPEQQTAIRCYDGFFCRNSTTPDSVYRDLCPAGFYCAEATTFINRYKFRCPLGFYCPEGTGARADLKRPLLQGSVCVEKQEFYLTQKVAQYCLRQIMRNNFEFVALEQLRLARANLPLIDKKEQTEIQSSWMEDYDLGYCQEDAIMAVWRKFKGHDLQVGQEREGILAMISAIQDVEFFKSSLLVKLLKSAEQYTNKCSQYSPLLSDQTFPSRQCPPDAVNCNNVTQLECLCTATSAAAMLDCFGGDYPAVECVDSSEDATCLDLSTDMRREGGEIDDFDLMAGNYLYYVQESLKEEMQARYAEGESTMTRCPFGTMTPSDGEVDLRQCEKRSSPTVSYLLESLDMIVQRINPVDTAASPKKWVKSAGDPEINEGEFRPVYAATAGSVTLITFDVRHLPQETVYGKHWRIKFYVGSELDPLYSDPIECHALVAARTPEKRDLDVKIAKSRGCAEISLPPAFEQEGNERGAGGLANGVFTFLLHPIVDIEWRVEVQIVDGVYQPDAFMLLSSALVEYAEPARAEVDTKKAFAIMLNSDLQIELPANMPLKSFEEGANQQILTQVFLNWLPLEMKLENYMRPLFSAVGGGELEYVFEDKSQYWADSTEIFLPYLPYFSNCRGFGRTIPLWAITEQNGGCQWAPVGGEIGLLSLGSQAMGDSCSFTQVDCILDEVPSVRLSNPRWFEAATGTRLFDVTKDASLPAKLNNWGDDPVPVTEPVYLQRGIPESGALPQKVTIAFQYWQQGPRKKMLASGRAWYSEFITPDVAVQSGRAPFEYKLSVLYYPMTHFEVMVYFAFPMEFYVGFYLCMGVLSVAMVLVLWGYHRFMCRLSYPPRLIDFRHWTLFAVPQLRAFIMVFSIFFTPVFIGVGLLQGEVAGNRLPWQNCPQGSLKEECFLGILEMIPSSYDPETEVSATSFGERRTGRIGTLMICLAGYAISASLKLLVPAAVSNYYKREDKSGANKLRELINEEQAEEAAKGERNESETEAQVNPEQEEDSELPPIFTTSLWKRSALALLVYGNVAIQIGLMRGAFSDVYRDNIMFFLLGLFALRISIKVACTSFMCELMLTVPIAITNQTMAVFTLLAAPTLFDFLVMYVALIGLQMIERIYIGPNEDVVMGKLAQWKRTFDGYMKSLSAAKPKKADDDEESEDEKKFEDQDKLEVEGETEEMVSFLATVSADSIANLVVPTFYAFCMLMFEESRVLSNFRIPQHNAEFYLYFYMLMLPFQMIADRICFNIVECYHGWKVTDYLEYCAYRFLVRTTDWKGKDNILDQTLSPHVRSIDQMCFSDQFYFVCLMQCIGAMSLVFGMQIIFEAGWNMFEDPATPVVLGYALCLCRGTSAMTGVSAGYLKIWVVRYRTWAETGYQQAIMKKMQAMSGSTADEKPPPPPAGSVHDGWPEPAHYDKHGMERYRVAFLAENQLWLQVAVSEMMDKRTLEKHRQDLLDGLASIVNEVAPKDYAPEGTEAVEKEMFQFGAPPAMDLARAASEIQRETYENSALRQLMRMWRERAQFMLFLQQVSAMVKLDNYHRRDACEICGKSKDELPVVVLPIYTLLHLASLYREQRDMSPLWNTPLWKHFYQTFTPTCTLCEECAKYYHKRNTNIPVNEKRYQRLQAKQKSAYEKVRVSDYPVITMEPEMKQVLNLWLEWTRCIVRDERPQDFLPRFGIEGRTMQEIRKELLDKGGADDVSLPSVSDKEDEAAAADDDGIKDPRKIDLEADDIAQKPPLKVPKSLTWSEESIMRSWLHRARDSLQAPQTVNWMYPMEAGPSSSSQNDAQESRPEATKAGVRFAATTDDDED